MIPGHSSPIQEKKLVAFRWFSNVGNSLSFLGIDLLGHLTLSSILELCMRDTTGTIRGQAIWH